MKAKFPFIFNCLCKCLLLSLLSVPAINGHAQPGLSAIDSLKSKLKAAKADTNTVKLLLALGDAYQTDSGDLVQAKVFYNKAGLLSRHLHYKGGILNYIFDYADVMVQQGKFDSSLLLSKQAQSMAANARDSVTFFRAIFNMGVSYDGLGKMQQAITCFLKTRDYYQRKNKQARVAMCDNELMLLFLNAKQYEQAVHYGKETVNLYKQYRPENKLSTPLQNLAVVYQTIKQYNNALPLLQKALHIDRKYHNQSGELDVLINLVDLKFHSNNLQGIRGDIERFLYLSRKMKIDEGICDGFIDMAQLNMWQSQIDKAQIYADSALLIAQKMNSNDLKRQCYFMLSHIAYSARHYSKAMHYDEQIDLTQEAINTANVNQSLIDLQTKYQTEKKIARIKQLQDQQQLQSLSLERKRIYIAVLILLLVTLSLIGLLYYRNYQRRQKLLLTEQQLQQHKIAALEQDKLLLATEAVLKGQDEERNRLAKDLHDGLGGILSSAKYSLNDMKENIIITPENAFAFERTMGILDKSISELRRVAHNMMPESLMHQSLSDALGDVCNHLSASTGLAIDYRGFGMNDDRLDNPTKVTVYRIIQELLNNIIKHAGATQVIVQVIAKDTTLHITVEDNGKGFEIKQLSSAEGIGYKNIRSRIDYLKGKIDIQSQSGKGTSVYIEIPIQL